MDTITKFNLSYCDYIAKVIKDGLAKESCQLGSKVAGVGKVKFNLDPEGGWMIDTSKKLNVIDINGKHYQVIIKEVK